MVPSCGTTPAWPSAVAASRRTSPTATTVTNRPGSWPSSWEATSLRLPPHLRDVRGPGLVKAGRLLVEIGDEALRNVLCVLVRKGVVRHLTHLRHDQPHLLPDKEQFHVVGAVEELVIEDTGGDEGGGHLPVGGHHAVV